MTNSHMAHVTEAAQRDPATIERTPGVDPRHIDEAKRRRAERDEFLTTAPSAFTGSILGPIRDALAGN